MAASNNIGKRITNVTSGQDAQMLLNHTSNTANSNALYDIQVAGTSGGDSAALFGNGTNTFGVGMDNSDSQSYVISSSSTLGTNNNMRIDRAGQITTPRTSAFMAYVTGTSGGVTGAGTTYNVISYTKLYDYQNEFSATTGVFTATRSGRYLFSCGMNFGSVTAAMTSGVFGLVTTGGTYRWWTGSPGLVMNIGNSMSYNQMVCVSLTAGQTAFLQATFSNGAGDTATITGLSGSLVRSWFGGLLIA